jgi:cyclic pyranopterin phosphate synthase
MGLLREGNKNNPAVDGTDSALAAYIRETMQSKEERHHIGEAGFLKPTRSMVQIGG